MRILNDIVIIVKMPGCIECIAVYQKDKQPQKQKSGHYEILISLFLEYHSIRFELKIRMAAKRVVMDQKIATIPP